MSVRLCERIVVPVVGGSDGCLNAALGESLAVCGIECEHIEFRGCFDELIHPGKSVRGQLAPRGWKPDPLQSRVLIPRPTTMRENASITKATRRLSNIPLVGV